MQEKGKVTVKINLAKKIKLTNSQLVIFFVLAISTFATYWVYAAFSEPTVAPASSTQDFTQNVLGANNADNAYDSSGVVANEDGSILERLEYIRTNNIGACGDGTVQATERCDDGNNSWTVGTCAGNCTRRNSWSNPKFGTFGISSSETAKLLSWCQLHSVTYSWTYGGSTYNKTYTFSTYTSLTGSPVTQIWCY